MNSEEFCEEVLSLYKIIQYESDKKKMEFIEEGFLEKLRINYEYINLDFIFDRLIAAIPSIINNYRNKYYNHIIQEMYCVFIAALCEIAKRGFSQGGILKQIEAYVEYGYKIDGNRYYPLIKAALKSEHIKIFEAGHQYEATIVYEAGIPRKLHRNVYELFEIYWKWMRGVETGGRRDFLRAFIEKQPINDAYIFDINDRKRITQLRDSMSSFQEKVIKTCIRIDKIYSEIDKTNTEVTTENIDELCSEISEKLGYNILTVINEKELKNNLIEYAHCIGFRKFKNIIENLPADEMIKLPTGQIVCCEQYRNIICGNHVVRNVTYEVVFPYGLKCRDYFELPREKVIKRNDQYIYISDDYFPVEIDGYDIGVRQLVWNNQLIYVYAGKIPVASSAYIDGKIINCIEDVKLQTSIRKTWDKIAKKNRLILCIDEIKIFNPQYAMQAVEISCNVSKQKIVKQINQYGHCRLAEKWVEIEELSDVITVEAKIKGTIVAEKEIYFESEYIYSLQTGNRIQNSIEWENWHCDNRLIIFSKTEIYQANFDFEYQDRFLNMYVYLGWFDFNENSIEFNSTVIEIIRSKKPAIKLRTEVLCYEDCLCIQPEVPIKLSALNCDNDELYLKISHGEERYKGKFLKDIKKHESFYLADCDVSCADYYGRWIISLYKDQEKVYSLSFYVLASIDIQLAKDIYAVGETVVAKLHASNPCFTEDGELTDYCEIPIGTAQLNIEGNHVGSELIDFEIADANCTIQYQIQIRPDVWGLKVQENHEWIETNKNMCQLNLSDDAQASLEVCSTKGQRLLIKSSDCENFRDLNPGFNRISWRFLKDNWNYVNDFVACNYLGEQIKFRILFEPHLIYRYLERQDQCWIAVFLYKGPLETNISLSAFVGDKLVTKIQRVAEKSYFDIRLVIDSITTYNGMNLVIQTRINGGDPDVVFNTHITIEDHCKEIISKPEKGSDTLVKNLTLQDCIRTMSILKYNSKAHTISLKTLDLLKDMKEM